MKIIIALFIICFIPACANLNPMVAGYGEKVVRDVQGANDNLIHGLEVAICGVPYGAILRNPEFIPVAKAACLANGDQSNPNLLLERMPVVNAKPSTILMQP